ncbi:ATP-grasp domain-containing protein [Sporomusa sphaeroides]|uniref:ATP-grasp domain-containing protein n=1 Tax=Sporomusa sphaeroides TaxID=47679 RepID=UPI00202EA5B9|nr:ATP-grasp domain-containing protein [Sporomusa sphaeroides]MCM0759204.1 ATP-grasp domain-containing protein [Sporomusa sphaeroides DSM 2875]HML35286.1 ATP-grasp domain-containing protein [Sporomusa sphaeroides]
MRLLIYELFSSGEIGNNSELSLLGFTMLNAVINDFAAIPGVEVVTILDRRFQTMIAQAAYPENVEFSWNHNCSGTGLEHFVEVLKICDGTLIIAPETDGILTKITGMAENQGKVVIGSSSLATGLAGNKQKVLELLKGKGFAVPKTELIPNEVLQQWESAVFKRFMLPFVLKPVTGTGGQGVFLIENSGNLSDAGSRLMQTSRQSYIIQEYIAGEAVSVSCLVAAGKAGAVSVNKQILKVNGNFHFAGISVPYSHPQAEAAKVAAQGACEAIAGLSGFVGVDLVLGETGPVIIEINPRVTAAYIALREVLDGNLAHCLYQACLQQKLPVLPNIIGTYTYITD